MDNVSKNIGIWTKPYGATATGLPFLGGQITAEELRRGEIRHAIGISLVLTDHPRSSLSWPAYRGDGSNFSKVDHPIPQGIRFRLDPTIDLNSIKNLHPIAKIIAKAAQTYGFVVWDGAGAISIRMQNPLTYMVHGEPNPYVELFNGTHQRDLLRAIPWDKLQFMPHDYGKP